VSPRDGLKAVEKRTFLTLPRLELRPLPVAIRYTGFRTTKRLDKYDTAVMFLLKIISARNREALYEANIGVVLLSYYFSFAGLYFL
jgi:hypothetical protein